jgi:hypothetical protein
MSLPKAKRWWLEAGKTRLNVLQKEIGGEQMVDTGASCSLSAGPTWHGRLVSLKCGGRLMRALIFSYLATQFANITQVSSNLPWKERQSFPRAWNKGEWQEWGSIALYAFCLSHNGCRG